MKTIRDHWCPQCGRKFPKATRERTYPHKIKRSALPQRVSMGRVVLEALPERWETDYKRPVFVVTPTEPEKLLRYPFCTRTCGFNFGADVWERTESNNRRKSA